ncbi:3-hydroxybutyryl-CoA dehydrogenase [Kutzneria viridogrisea]|uniref:3-hydroxybutyryl-CoA dehydrogenase n=2 Tax=Kutzneria TaxID=43356 RepID=W5W9G8_9PSEU|nr:3-hydroxybutyryl-CoA dehydrogenase [Kutzneria albida]AHH97161.1 3-hydroxybutyryl-CoA dehydrogenase [Kutzneria albida DSM 43870]MBA8931868.1 3-hydroxybutyryl-CoA dehydrogenase [Kutzneria viridogrisea]
MTTIARIGVVGAGLMGSGIAEVCAKAGLDVLVAEADAACLLAGRNRVDRSLRRGVRHGKLTEEQAQQATDRLRFTTDLDEFTDRQLVVEAVVEHEQVKSEVLTRLDKVLTDPEAILTTNTSSIPIMKLAMATDRADKVIGLHFFNPVPVLPLVEIVASLLTSLDTRTRVEGFVTGTLGKQVIRSQDRAGFVVNSLLVPYLLSAIRMVESGFASAADVDTGMVLGCAHPMGPLQLTDLIGLDTTKAIAESMYAEFKEPLYSPPPLLLRMVDAGLLGKKTGRGFYLYDGS